jgi:hypothetical protein
MNGNITKSPTEWRNYSTKAPIAAFHMRRGDLKRLYKIINDKQIEYRDRIVNSLSQMPQETADNFEARKIKVYEAPPAGTQQVRTVLLLAPFIQSRIVEPKERGQSASARQSISSNRFTMGIAASLKLPLAVGKRFPPFARCCSSENRAGSTSRDAWP